MIYYLYIKTHNITGLKYLGQTKKSDVNNYYGSGKYWIRHLNKHGYKISTEIIYETEDKNELKSAGIYYSLFYNVAKSEEWANLIPETGEGAFLLLEPYARNGSNNGAFGMKRLDLVERNKLGHSIETLNKLKKLKGDKNSVYSTHWWNNGIVQIMQKICPDGFIKGRLEKRLWYNNGEKELWCVECPIGFYKGRLKRKNKENSILITIYTKPNCSYCVSAKEYMKQKNIPFNELKLDQDFTRESLKAKYPQAITYPVVVTEFQYIGGFVDLKEKYNSTLEKKRYLDSGEWNGS